MSNRTSKEQEAKVTITKVGQLVTMTVIGQTYQPKTREQALAAAKAYGESLTPEEDAALTKAALDDPDTALITSLTKRRPGRPIADAPKKPVSIRLSPDVLDYYRATGPGWQGRIDETLRDAAGLKKRV